MKEVTVKTIFFSSSEEKKLEVFINEFLGICSTHNLNFREITSLFEKILYLPTDDDIDIQM